MACKITGASRKSWNHITWQSHFVQQTLHFSCKYPQLFLIKAWRNSTTHTWTTCLSQRHAGASPQELNVTINYFCCHTTCKPHDKASLAVLSAAILQQKSFLNRLDRADKHEQGCKSNNLPWVSSWISSWTRVHSKLCTASRRGSDAQHFAFAQAVSLCSLAARAREGNRAGSPGQERSPVAQRVFTAASQEHHAAVIFCSSESKLHISTDGTKFYPYIFKSSFQDKTSALRWSQGST